MEEDELKEYGVTTRVIQYYTVMATSAEEAKEAIRNYEGNLIETDLEEFVEVFPV